MKARMLGRVPSWNFMKKQRGKGVRIKKGDQLALRHGHAIPGHESRTYRSWQSMNQRCNNPKASFYNRYGGRGILVCKRWKHFENFLADMGERPVGTTLDRYPNNDGNYELTNCRWATPEQQTWSRG